jgi:hypothetical protein
MSLVSPLRICAISKLAASSAILSFGWFAVVSLGQVWREKGLFSNPVIDNCFGISIFNSLAAKSAPAAISSLHDTIAVGLLLKPIKALAPSTPDSNQYSPAIIRVWSILILCCFSAAL